LPRTAMRADVRTTSAAVPSTAASPATDVDVAELPTATGPANSQPTGIESSDPATDVGDAPNQVTTPNEPTVAPGLSRFAVVEPKLAGGSLPTIEGLDWLQEKGYKTLVDLRPAGEVQSSFLAEVSRRGLRYVSLPVSLTQLDEDHVLRFHFEISLNE